MTVKRLKSPYPYFGGKSRVASQVWRRFGNPPNFVSPFFGSGAVLLDRPDPPGVETVNDLNGWLTNFWRAVQREPDKVAEFADYPVSELDLHARGDWLFYREGAQDFVERLRGDPDYYCVKSAGWWVWGLCCWLGSGWGDKNPVKTPSGQGVWRTRPQLGDANPCGVMSNRVWRQIPYLSGEGQGINRKSENGIAQYLRDLSERTQNVRVVCGDWTRVTGETVTTRHGLTAVDLDPPYGNEDRHACYQENSHTVAGDVRQWCKENGDNPLLRIALFGYASEGHEELEALGWEVEAWETSGGYANQRRDSENNNGKRERIWYSPHCLRPELSLFG